LNSTIFVFGVFTLPLYESLHTSPLRISPTHPLHTSAPQHNLTDRIDLINKEHFTEGVDLSKCNWTAHAKKKIAAEAEVEVVGTF
jgi:hypothetical protein